MAAVSSGCGSRRLPKANSHNPRSKNRHAPSKQAFRSRTTVACTRNNYQTGKNMKRILGTAALNDGLWFFVGAQHAQKTTLPRVSAKVLMLLFVFTS
jgi:hypothetical protein